MKNRCTRWIAQLLIVTITAIGFPHAVSAGVVTTQAAAASAEKDRIRTFLDREDVRTALTEQGVDPAAARARVDALTDEEARDLAGRIDSLPAGGNAIIGALVFIFVVLLITDILGLTKVFPFTRSLR